MNSLHRLFTAKGAGLISRSSYLQMVGCPLVVGFSLAIIQNVQIGNWTRSALARFGLSPVHPIPTAWDWKFSNGNNQWVLVTLTDGSQVAGHLGSESFVSSEPTERDIYIQKIYALDPATGNWKEAGNSGILIASGQVQNDRILAIRHKTGVKE